MLLVEIVAGTAIGLLGWVVGFACGFLFELREHRAERQQWMSFHQQGSFEKPPARHYTPDTAESRIDRASKVVTDWSKESVSQGMAELKQMYRDEGLPIPKDKELRAEVEAMLNAAAQGEGAIDA